MSMRAPARARHWGMGTSSRRTWREPRSSISGGVGLGDGSVVAPAEQAAIANVIATAGTKRRGRNRRGIGHRSWDAIAGRSRQWLGAVPAAGAWTARQSLRVEQRGPGWMGRAGTRPLSDFHPASGADGRYGHPCGRDAGEACTDMAALLRTGSRRRGGRRRYHDPVADELDVAGGAPALASVASATGNRRSATTSARGDRLDGRGGLAGLVSRYATSPADRRRPPATRASSACRGRCPRSAWRCPSRAPRR